MAEYVGYECYPVDGVVQRHETVLFDYYSDAEQWQNQIPKSPSYWREVEREVSSFTNSLHDHVMARVYVNDERNELIFERKDGKVFKFYHDQSCCESVMIEDITGDLNDLVGSPLLVVDESSNHETDNYNSSSCTWTFYKFATIKGWVDVRWYGTSNGYYSESVNFARVK